MEIKTKYETGSHIRIITLKKFKKLIEVTDDYIASIRVETKDKYIYITKEGRELNENQIILYEDKGSLYKTICNYSESLEEENKQKFSFFK